MRGGLRRELAVTLMAPQELLTKGLMQAIWAVNAHCKEHSLAGWQLTRPAAAVRLLAAVIRNRLDAQHT